MIEAKRGINIAPATIVLLGVMGAVFYRNPLLLTDPQMFSEDIFVYFNEDRLFGASALIRPYAGYIQLCCRIIAFIVGFFPARYAADLYAAFFVATILATSAVIYTSPIFTGWGKVIAALALVYSPTGSETFFGMPYTQWIMAPVVGLALYESPTTRTRAAVLLGDFAMLGLSAPFVILAAPFVAWKAYRERSRYSYALCAIAVAVTIIQIHGIIGRSAINPAAGSIFERAFMATSVFYAWATGPDYPGFRRAVAISVPTVAFAFWYLWQNRKGNERALLYFVAYGAVVLGAGCLQVDAPLHANQFLFGARYFYPPVVLFVLTFVVIEQNSNRASLSIPLVAAAMGLVFVTHVTNMNIHFTYRNWSETADCLEHRSNCVTGLNPGNTGSVRIPSGSELKTMSTTDRLKFINEQRIP